MKTTQALYLLDDFAEGEVINPIAAACMFEVVNPETEPDSGDQSLSKRSELHPLSELVDDVLEDLKPRTGKVKIWVELDKDSGWYCDRAEMRGVLLSLIGRALDAVPAKNGHICIRCLADGRAHTRLEVIDNGPEIPASQLATIFKPGMRVVESSEGEASIVPSLFSVRNIVELHGGAIEVESIPGEGTTLSVTLESALPAEIVA